MSAILAIETSTPQGGLAVFREGKLLYEHALIAERSHNAAIFGPLEKALEASQRNISRIVVGTGPGSYTGIRIGIAAATGIALGCGAELVGLPSLCAAPVDEDSYIIIGNARRGSWFRAEVVDRKLMAEPQLIPEEQLQDTLDSNVLSFDETTPFENVRLLKPSAEWLARLAHHAEPQATVEPIYLRAPFITKPRKIGKSAPPTSPPSPHA